MTSAMHHLLAVLRQLRVRAVLAGALLGSAGAALAQVQASPPPAPQAQASTSPTQARRQQQPPVQAPAPMPLELFVGESRVLPALKATRVAVGSGAILTANVLDQQEILLFGNAPGHSTLHVWTPGGHVLEYRITVRPADMSRLRHELQTLFSELDTLDIRVVADKVVLDGHSLSEEQLAKIDEIAKRYPQVVNLTQFQKDKAWEKMVAMDVRVVEFRNRDKVRELGIRWDDGMPGPAFGIAGDIKHSPTRGSGPFLLDPPAGTPITGADTLARPLAPFRTYLGLISSLHSRIQLMETDGDAVTLAQPQLTARSGKTAEFQIGGSIPYAVVGPLGQPSISFQPYGIIVHLKPWVDRLQQVQSDIMAEVSEPDPDVNPHAGVPGLRKRMARTSFNVRAGETMVIAGLLQRRKGESVTQVPGLGSLPVVGELFKSRRSADSESELVIFVTPTIVDLGDADQARRLGNALLRAERYFDPPAREAKPAPAPQPFPGGGTP